MYEKEMIRSGTMNRINQLDEDPNHVLPTPVNAAGEHTGIQQEEIMENNLQNFIPDMTRRRHQVVTRHVNNKTHMSVMGDEISKHMNRLLKGGRE